MRTIAIDGRPVAFATSFAGTRARPAIRVTLDDGDYAEEVMASVRATFVPPPRHFAELRRADPLLARLETRYRGFRPVLQLNLLGALLRCISAQQVNLRWASETRRRLAERFGDKHVVDGTVVYSLNPERLGVASPAEIRALQFTNRKAEYIVAVAQAVASGQVSVERLATLSDAAVIEELVVLRGIGVWTAEWILARTLGRPARSRRRSRGAQSDRDRVSQGGYALRGRGSRAYDALARLSRACAGVVATRPGRERARGAGSVLRTDSSSSADKPGLARTRFSWPGRPPNADRAECAILPNGFREADIRGDHSRWHQRARSTGKGPNRSRNK